MGAIRSFEDLEVWKMARALRIKFYAPARQLPDHERYNLASQIRSVAVSLTANIAEGYGRYHDKENVQFCRVSRGSASELLDHLIACNDEGYLDDTNLATFRSDLTRFLQLLNGYIRSIGSRRVADDG